MHKKTHKLNKIDAFHLFIKHINQANLNKMQSDV